MKCKTGCIVFENGDTRHHKDCYLYPESLSQMIDKLKEPVSNVVNPLLKDVTTNDIKVIIRGLEFLTYNTVSTRPEYDKAKKLLNKLLKKD